MSKRVPTILALLCLVSLAACITVNIYFPAPEVRAAAEDIVEETWGNVKDTESDHGVDPDARRHGEARSIFTRASDMVGPVTAHAQQANINVSTAAIRALKASMKQRAAKLKPRLNAGQVGLGKDGMLVVRDLEGLSLRERADVRRLVDAEGRDRRSLYKEIAKANDFEDDRVNDIQNIFAETWRRKAEKGWRIQNPDGGWTQR